MVRGGVRKTDVEQINDLFRLTAPDWVSTPESEERRRMIADNEWSKGPLSAGTKSQYQTALRKWLSYAAMQAREDPSFTSLQDSDNKVYAFLNWLLDDVEAHNANADQKARLAPAQQLEHALQALRCVKKCQAGVPGQKEGWSGNDAILKGAMTRARTMQAALQASAVRSSGLNAKILTASQYNACLDEAWTFGASPEAAQTGIFMVAEATIATTCGLRAEDSAELRCSRECVTDYSQLKEHSFAVRDEAQHNAYGSFKTPDLFLKKATLNPTMSKQHYYEVLLTEKPRYFAQDLDWDLARNPDKLAVVKRHVDFTRAFVRDTCGMEVGAKVEVSEATGWADDKGYNKASFHIKYYFWFPDHAPWNDFAKRLHAAITELADPLLMWRKGEGEQEPIMDKAPYTKNQSWRLLYCSKKGSERMLLPVMESSADPKDHLLSVSDEQQLAHPQLPALPPC